MRTVRLDVTLGFVDDTYDLFKSFRQYDRISVEEIVRQVKAIIDEDMICEVDVTVISDEGKLQVN